MQIDVYNDYLAMIGYNYERSIYTDYMDYFPYILLQSITAGDMIYWAKTFPNKALQSFRGV